MTAPRIVYETVGDVAHIRFDNPQAFNALTKQMWLDMRDAARAIADDPTIRVAVFRGRGGKAFVSGTDISGFATFTSGADGIAYEQEIDDCMRALDAVPVTTIAVVDGWAVGGGLNIAAACDFRIATPDARFGSPIGRTLGNCLSALSLARIGGAIGVAMARRMVLLGEIITAPELVAGGFLLRVVERDAIDAEIETLCRRAAGRAAGAREGHSDDEAEHQPRSLRRHQEVRLGHLKQGQEGRHGRPRLSDTSPLLGRGESRVQFDRHHVRERRDPRHGSGGRLDVYEGHQGQDDN